MLEFGCTNSLSKLVEEHVRQSPVDNSNVCEAESEIDVLVILDQVSDGEPQSSKGVLHHIFSKASTSCYWDGVGINATETLLIDRVLRDRGIELLFAMVSVQQVLQGGIDNKNGLHVMDILSLDSLGE